MGTSLMAVLVFFGPVVTFGRGDDKTPVNDLAHLQGVWRIRELDVHVDAANGGTVPSRTELQKWRWVVKDNTVTWIYPSSPSDKESFVLHSNQTPKWIDLTNTVKITPNHQDGKSGKPKVEQWTFYGIYEIKGNTLRVCLPTSQTGNKIRPVEFSGREGSGCVVWILERVEKKD